MPHTATLSTPRRYDLDALRGLAMLQGIALHAAIAFRPGVGGWMIKDSQISKLIASFIAAIHGFRMPPFFLIMGNGALNGASNVGPDTRMIRFTLATWLCCLPAFPANAEPPITKNIVFQGQSWTGLHPAELDTTYHQGRESLLVRTNGIGSMATVDGVEFQTGTIEMDISAPQRSQPTLALFVDKSGKNFDRVTLNPWPVYAEEPPRRLRQGIVTTGDQQSVVVNFHHGNQDEWQRERWFHVRLEICESICRIYIDDDRDPAFLFATSERAKLGGGIGIVSSSVYIRNLQVQPLNEQAGMDASGDSMVTQSFVHQLQR